MHANSSIPCTSPDGVIAGITTNHQIATPAFTQSLEYLARARRVVIKQHHRFVRWAAALNPHLALGCRWFIGWLEYLYPGFIHVDDIVVEQRIAAQIMQRLQRLGSGNHGSRQALSRHRD